MQRSVVWIGASVALCALALSGGGAALAEDDLCGRPREAPDALYRRLTQTEKLAESFRDKAYVTINDAARGTLWTFTVAGHPAHPSVVCRQPVEEGGKPRIDMGIVCEASDEECERLAHAFEALNAKMLKDAERQGK
jgi:hypothetical protein